MTDAAEHVATSKYQRAFDEWRSECSCGWVGSYWKLEAAAEREAVAHVEGSRDG